MKSTLESSPLTPPGLINSLKEGFDAVASHISLILFPIGLDLLLWFGVHLRIQSWLQPIIESTLKSASVTNSPDLQSMVEASRQTWDAIAANFNLVSFLRSYPLGIPSLLSGMQPATNPLGTVPVFDITTSNHSLIAMLLFIVCGSVLGGLYFYLVARVAGREKEPMTLAKSLVVIGQALLFCLVFYGIAVLVAIPLLTLISIVFMFSPSLGQLVLIAMVFVLAWLTLPLIFSTHGIFLYRQSVRLSLANSIRLSRYAGPQIAMFAVVVLVLGTGLNMLWAIPEQNSWLLLIGITGHAFISTGLLAGSFIYYKSYIRWMQEIIQRRLANSEPVM